MTEPEKQNAPTKGDPAEDPATDPTAAEPPAPEPWTGRRVAEWNAYYDLYVAGFVVLLALLGSANKIHPNNSGLWGLLQAGREVAATGGPVLTDTTSIAGQGLRWANVPWLFELIHYELYATVASVVPPPEPGSPLPPVGTGPAEQYAAGSLIALDAVVRGLTAWLLLGFRRKGPGLWWAAVCATLAVGVALGPSTVETFAPAAGGDVIRTARPSIDVTPGGIAGPAAVSPDNWGLLFFTIELLLLHKAINLGQTGRIYGLIPLFLVWANMDESYSFGLIVLAAAMIGPRAGGPRRQPRPSMRTGLVVLAACFAATFASPSHVFGVLASFATIYRTVGLTFGPPTPTPIAVFGAGLGNAFGVEFARSFQIYYLALVGGGLFSFYWNRNQFSVGRFLIFVAASVLWGLALNFTALFAVTFAATLALNGQEWYHDAVGTEGRLGAGWTIWSTGGRLVTLALIFLVVASGVTGYRRQIGEAQFGFGFNPDDFPFEAAEALKVAPIEGNILNTSLPQGDALAWRDAGKRKSFIDSRIHLYPREAFSRWDEIRKAIRDDKVDRWQPILDDYHISVLMIQLSGLPRDNSPLTYARLMNSTNWIPFYDDGAVAMFGRADSKAPAADLAYFKANRLDAEDLAYRRPRPIPPWERPPTPTYEPLDYIFQNRLLNRPQPHTEAAIRWLRPAEIPPGAAYLPDPAHCLMAIREARAALAIKPDDPTAFRRLFEAYRLLLAQESALIAGIPLTTENIARIIQATPQTRLLANRSRQLLTALNFTIQTLPPTRTAAERVDKIGLNSNMAQLYLQSGALDLALERLATIEPREGEMDEGFFQNLTRQVEELKQRVEQVQNQANDLAINRRATPLDKAALFRSQGTPGLAIHELEEARDAGSNPAPVLSSLVDLYCDAGQPEKALEVIGTLNVDDPSLSTGRGTASYRQGKVYFLLGNYEHAVSLWRDKSIGPIQTDRSLMAPMATLMLLNGDPMASVRTFLELPQKMDQQAVWEFELALAALEGGLPPDIAAEHFQTALKLDPALPVRPVIAYYLGKLGKPVPPPRTAAPRPAPVPPTPPGTPRPELPEDPFAP